MCEQTTHRPAATVPTTDDDLFVASGGSVLVTALIGEVVTAVESTPPGSTLVVTVDAGDVEIAHLWRATTYTQLPTGRILGWDQALTVVSVDTTVAPTPRHPLAISDGATIRFKISPATTGQVRWTAVWRPLDEGAVLTAA